MNGCFCVVRGGGMNEQNLIQNSGRSRDEVEAVNAKGGRASGKTRRRKRDMKAKMKMILELPVSDCSDFNAVSELGIAMNEIDNETLMLAGLFQKAKNGDVQAIREVRSIIGKDHASAELAIRKEELKLKKQQLQNGTSGEKELPALLAALEADDE